MLWIVKGLTTHMQVSVLLQTTPPSIGAHLGPAFRHLRAGIRGQERQKSDQAGDRVFNETGIMYNVSSSFFFFFRFLKTFLF